MLFLCSLREGVMSEPLPESLSKVDREALMQELLAEAERTVNEVADAVDGAPTGRIIRDSEESARDALDRFRQIVYERVLQAEVDAAEAAFPPSGQLSDRQEEEE